MPARAEGEASVGCEPNGRELKERDEREGEARAAERGEIATREERPDGRHRRKKSKPEALASRERDRERRLRRERALAIDEEGEKEGDEPQRGGG